MRLPRRIAAPLAALAMAAALPASAQFVAFTPNNPIGGAPIGFAFAGDMFVGSIQKDGTGVLYSTDLNGGSVAPFASSVSLAGTTSSEHYVAASIGLGGFPNRDIYVASANGVKHITHDGLSSNDFVTGLTGGVRGILFDAVGSFGHDMIVTTTAGEIYRINSAGQFIDSGGIAHAAPTPLASTGEDTEGLDVAPTGAGAHFGSLNGDLVVASEGSGKLRAYNTAGVETDVATVGSAEELSFVPLDLGVSGDPVEGMYGANYSVNVVKAPASAFSGFQGDLIITGETTHQVSRVHFNGSTFDVLGFATFPNQPEDGLFVTRTHILGATPTPNAALILLAGGGLACFRVLGKRHTRTSGSGATSAG